MSGHLRRSSAGGSSDPLLQPPPLSEAARDHPRPRTPTSARLEAIERFLDLVVGKGVVRLQGHAQLHRQPGGPLRHGGHPAGHGGPGPHVEEVDVLTGPAVGRPKSATFRTGDIAGVDIVARVASNLYQAVPDDPERETFASPASCGAVERRWLGDKTGGGFYRKDGPQILALDWKTLEYHERRKPKFASVEAAQPVEDVGARIRQILGGKDQPRPGARTGPLSTSVDAASLVPEMTDDVVAVDRVDEWGNAWDQADRLPVAGAVPLRPERRRPGAGDLRRRGLGSPRSSSGATAGACVLPPARRAGRGPGGRARARRKGPTADRGAAGLRPRPLLRDGERPTPVFGPSGALPLPERQGVLDIATVKAAGGASGRRTPARASSTWATAARSSSSTPR